MEKRLLLAFVLSAAILLAWSVLFPPPQPTRTIPAQEPTQLEGVDVAAPPTETAPDQRQAVEPAIDTVADELLTEAVGAAAEERVVLRNDRIEVELTNRGAAITAYRLSRYDGDDGQPLDLVQTVPVPDRSLALQLVTPDGPDNATLRG